MLYEDLTTDQKEYIHNKYENIQPNLIDYALRGDGTKYKLTIQPIDITGTPIGPVKKIDATIICVDTTIFNEGEEDEWYMKSYKMSSDDEVFISPITFYFKYQVGLIADQISINSDLHLYPILSDVRSIEGTRSPFIELQGEYNFGEDFENWKSIKNIRDSFGWGWFSGATEYGTFMPEDVVSAFILLEGKCVG